MSHFVYSDKVKAMKPSIIRELLKQMADPTLISFAGGNPSAEAFPADEIREISAELLAGPPAFTLQYSVTEGIKELRDFGKKYVNSIAVTQHEFDDIMVTSGSQQAMDLLSKVLCNDGDIVATEEPTFVGGINCFRSNGAQPVGVTMEPDGVNLEALERVLSAAKKPKFFYTIPNFQNPTGYTTSLAKRKAIYELCKKYGVPILEDNPYGELRFTGEDLPPIKSFDEDGLVVYAASLSKVFAPGLRIALCVGAKEIIGKMAVAKQGVDVHSNLWAQRVAVSFYEKYSFDEHIQRLRGVYRAKAELMMKNLDEKLADKASYVPTEGGMFLWLTLPQGVDMQQYVKRCLEKKVAIVPGSAFMIDGAVPCSSVRLNYSSPSDAQIDEGTTIMAQVLSEMM